MSSRLLDQQTELLEHLTSAAAIFGAEPGEPVPPAPEGIDPGLLHIEARMSHEKRTGKIAALLPKTFALLGERRDAILRAFAAACFPASIGRLANARQFQEFLAVLAAHAVLEPAYLLDIARCECAIAELYAEVPEAVATLDAAPRPMVRRSAGVGIVRCAYDVRSVLADEAAVPVRRDTPLVIAKSPQSGVAAMARLPPAVFEVMVALERWTALDELARSEEALCLVRDLAAAGLLEVRP